MKYFNAGSHEDMHTHARTHTGIDEVWRASALLFFLQRREKECSNANLLYKLLLRRGWPCPALPILKQGGWEREGKTRFTRQTDPTVSDAAPEPTQRYGEGEEKINTGSMTPLHPTLHPDKRSVRSFSRECAKQRAVKRVELYLVSAPSLSPVLQARQSGL